MPDTSAALPPTVNEFLLDQIGRLAAFDFVSVGSASGPFLALEVYKNEADGLEVRIPPRAPAMPLPEPNKTALAEAGFSVNDATRPQEPWIRSVADPEAAIEVIVSTLTGIFGIGIDGEINLVHGNRRAEHEVAQQLEAYRAKIETVLSEIFSKTPAQDSEGDFILPFEHMQITVAPRIVPGAPPVLRVFAITNTEVTVAPELGLFLARLNFGMMFGRFALDAENAAIWFDETLVGDISQENLGFTLNLVAQTTSQWDKQLQQMFGGKVHADRGKDELPLQPKPGFAGYNGYL